MIFRNCIFLSVLFILPGCATLDIVAFGVSGISFITTGKSLSDHAISAMTNQDCAMHRLIFDETMCRDNGGLVETNGKGMLAKTSTKKATLLSISPEKLMEADAAAIMAPSTNIMELTTSVEKENALSSFGKNKQFIKSQRGLHEVQWDTVTQYKVIGSFNNKLNATAFANLHQEIGAMVIANGKTHTEKLAKIHGAKYRVVLAPYLTNPQSIEAEKITKTEKRSYWMLSLCIKSLRPPPCINESISLASANTD